MLQIELNENDKRKCVGYLRVSSEEQLKGYSILNQDNTVKRTAEFLGIPMDEVYKDEAKSAYKQNVIRKDYEKMVNEIRENKIKLIIVWKLDRLIRNHIKNEELFQLFDKFNVKLISCTENIDFSTADGRKEIRKKGVDNQYESERTSERVSEVLKASASLGNFPKSVVPLGYQRIHNEFKSAPLEIDSITGQQVIAIFKKMNEMKWGIKKMLHWLIAEQYMNINWTEKLLYSLLENEIYIGIYVSNRKTRELVIPNHTPALIPKDLFFKIQELIHSRNYDRKYHYIFKGYLHCHKCKRKLTPNPAHNGKSNKLYQYYHCEHCNKRINQDKLITMMLNEIDQRIDSSINQAIITDLIAKLDRIDYLINENQQFLLDFVITVDYHKEQQEKLLKERKSIERTLKKYKSANSIYFEFLDFHGKRKWLTSNVSSILFDFEKKDYKINYIDDNKQS